MEAEEKEYSDLVNEGFKKKVLAFADETLTLHFWEELQDDLDEENEGEQAFRGNGKLTPEQEEIRRLRAENKRLKMEKEILKKATVFFAKETK